MEDDFNPREGEDFGDFKTASSSNAAKTSTSGSGGGGDDFFAVDFQAAFGAGGPTSSGGAAAQSQIQPSLIGEVIAPSLPSDNLSLSPPLLAASAAANSDNHMDLLGLGGLEFNNSVLNAGTGNVINERLIPANSQPVSQQNLHLQNFHNNQQQQLYQQSNPISFEFDSILQPVMKSNVQSNNINNNSSVPNKQPTSLQGTTWSDLNISIDDLTINPAARNQANKLSMNQLKSMNK
jgi:hypothetical protein